MERDTVDDIEAWDNAASIYAAMIGGANDSFWRRFEPFLRHWLPDSGGSVLDLGCGHGWLAADLASKGFEVEGVDGSQELVERARRDFPDLRLGVRDLVEGLGTDWVGPYDVVVSHMVLMDLPRIDRVLADVTERLALGGTFVATMLHPAFFNQAPIYEGDRHRRVTGYLREEEWWIESFGGHRHYHRPFAWYVRALRAAGMALVDLDEPRTLPVVPKPEYEWSADEEWFSTIPTMLSFAAKRCG
ncbi:MAG: class I SAM-dependent methyltransferase [Nocardioides sp.]